MAKKEPGVVTGADPGREPQRGAGADRPPLVPVVVREVGSVGPDDPLVHLLATEGHVLASVRSWCATGRVFSASEPGGDALDGPFGAALVVPVDSGCTVELRAFAVPDNASGWCVDDLLADVFDRLRSEGTRRVVAVASDAEPDRLGHLRRAGFRHCDAPWLQLEL